MVASIRIAKLQLCSSLRTRYAVREARLCPGLVLTGGSHKQKKPAITDGGRLCRRCWSICYTCHMTAGSAQPVEAERFTAPEQVNHRRYEALRAFFVDGLGY